MKKHEGMKLKNIDEIKAKSSSVKELKGREKLSDEDLEKISGGCDHVVFTDGGEDQNSPFGPILKW